MREPRLGAVAAAALEIFDARGAELVDIPILQPADPFLDTAGEDLRRRIFLTESETGETLCLRPEFTIPVCLDHIASQAGTPRRYSYLGEVFRQRREGGNEFFQAGIEDLGDTDTARADARLVADAHALLTRTLPGVPLAVMLGDQTIFGPHATLGGHVHVEDYANVSAGTAVHQFCRVGKHGFLGGYSVVTKDAMPFGKTIGSRPARIFGANTIGLQRRGFTVDTIEQLKRAYRYLLMSKLNTSRALIKIEQDPTLTSPEVRYLVDFIRQSKRGVILRKPTRRLAEELVADE